MLPLNEYLCQVMDYEVMPDDWSVPKVLDHIAQADPPYHALIDTGAIITGMTNLDVAHYLLDNGLSTMQGVVYLDEMDRKMILLRDGKKIMKLNQCGLGWGERFSFYDQVRRPRVLVCVRSHLRAPTCRCTPRVWTSNKSSTRRRSRLSGRT